MATHSSTLAWRIPWREEPGRLQSMGRKDSDTTERLHTFILQLKKKKEEDMATERQSIFTEFLHEHLRYRKSDSRD